MTYDKPWKSYEDQLNQLIQRGLIVTHRSKALESLERIGYYRLSGYWHPFRERSDTDESVLNTFKVGAEFKDTVKLYVFDKNLRFLALDALERIEIALRVDISHTLGEKDPYAYLKPEFLANNFSRQVRGVSKHQQWVDSHESLILLCQIN